MLAALTVFFLVWTAQAQTLETRITYTSRAARAAVVLPELGKLAGLDIKATPQTDDEILIISVKDQPLSDVLKRIATVTSGEWKQDGDVLRLVQNQKLRAQEEQQDLMRKAKAFQKLIDDRIDKEKQDEAQIEKAEKAASSATDKGKKGSDENDVPPSDPQELRRNLIGARLVTSLMQCVDPMVIAKNPGRTVFSTDPTHMQLPLGSKALDAINEFIQAHNALAPTVPPNFVDQTQGMDKEQAEEMRKRLMKQIGKIGPVAKVLLIRAGENTSYDIFGDSGFSVVLYDASGQVLFSIEPSPFPPYPGGIIMGAASDDTTPPQEVRYTNESVQLMQAVAGTYNSQKDFEVDGPLRRKLMLPTVYDPLSYYQTDEILAYAKFKGKPLVAEIPDDWRLVPQAFIEPTPHAMLSSVVGAIQEGDIVSEIQDPVFETLRPANPARSRQNRLNRFALAKLLIASEQNGIPDADDVLTFVRDTPKPATVSPMSLYLALVAPAVDSTTNGYDWHTLRFFGSLSQSQREKAIKEGWIKVGTLSTTQKALLEEILYRYGPPCTEISPINPSMIGLLDDVEGPKSYLSEQTEVAPNGLPDEVSVYFSAEDEPLLLRIQDNGEARLGMLSLVGPDTIAASHVMFTQDANLQRYPPMGKMRVGIKSAMQMTIHVGPKTQMGCPMSICHLPRDARVISEKDLPPDLRVQIAETIKNLQAQQSQSNDPDKKVIPPQ